MGEGRASTSPRAAPAAASGLTGGDAKAVPLATQTIRWHARSHPTSFDRSPWRASFPHEADPGIPPRPGMNPSSRRQPSK